MPTPMLNSLPDTFGEALRFLRKRARLTQDELGRAVGYSREQIARLENGSRLPDLAVIAALFVPALFQQSEKHLVEQLLALAGKTRRDQQVTITHTRQTRLEVTSETLLAPPVSMHLPPAPLLPLIGRTADVADLLALLETARLITIVGAPGIGKSRLALEVANQAVPHFADGVAFVPLADVTAAADVPYAVLRTLGLTPTPHQTAETAIAAYLAPAPAAAGDRQLRAHPGELTAVRRLAGAGAGAEAAVYQPRAAGYLRRARMAAGAAARARSGRTARCRALGTTARHAVVDRARPGHRPRLFFDLRQYPAPGDAVRGAGWAAAGVGVGRGAVARAIAASAGAAIADAARPRPPLLHVAAAGQAQHRRAPSHPAGGHRLERTRCCRRAAARLLPSGGLRRAAAPRRPRPWPAPSRSSWRRWRAPT